MRGRIGIAFGWLLVACGSSSSDASNGTGGAGSAVRDASVSDSMMRSNAGASGGGNGGAAGRDNGVAAGGGNHGTTEGGTLPGSDARSPVDAGAGRGQRDARADGASCPGPGSGGWAAQPVKLDLTSVQLGHGYSPRAGVDLAGNAIAVWEQDDFNAYYGVWAARRPAGGAFGKPIQIGAPATSVATAQYQETPPQLAVSDDGTAMAVWRTPKTIPEIHESHYMPGQGWTPEERVDPPPDDAGVGFVPVIGTSVVADGHGTFLVVWLWHSPDPATSAADYGVQIYARFYRAKSGWGAVTRLSSYGVPMPGSSQLSTSADTPVVTMNAAGDAVIAWIAQGNAMVGPAHGVEAIRYDPGTKAWGPETFVDVCNDCYPAASSAYLPKVHLAMNASGTAIAAYNRLPNISGDQDVWVSSSTSGAWSKPVAVDTKGNDIDPHVAIDSTGGATLAWEKDTDVIASSAAAGGSWGASVTLGNGPMYGPSGPIGVYADQTGDAFAVWSTTETIVVAERSAGAAAWTPFVTVFSASLAYDPDLALPRGSCGLPLLVFFGSPSGGAAGVFALDGK